MQGYRMSRRALGAMTVLALMIAGQVGAIFIPIPGPFPREGECESDDPFFDMVRHLLGPDNNIGPGTLKGTEVPEPSNLEEFVRDREAAIALGKAFFWDMQVGSDGIQACATCHFRAGADPRSRNQIAPGGNDDTTGAFNAFGPNYQLSAADFPLHEFADAADRTSEVLRSTDDVISSQGVVLKELVDAREGAKQDQGVRMEDDVFNMNGMSTRRVEPRNTPTVINAVFNHRNFWDGRADPIFNGVNEFGARDPDAKVLRADSSDAAEWVQVRIDNASLASQAVGPPNSTFEMGFVGRDWLDVGRRLADATPLKKQRVHPRDSVLSGMIRPSGKGLNGTYADLIQQAFEPVWWDSFQIVEVAEDGTRTILDGPRNGRLADNQYSMIQVNMSLFFGLAVQLYEATLVSDDAKIDQHFDSINAGGPGVLNAEELHGMELFEEAACADCHSGPEFSSAVVRTAVTGFMNDEVDPPFQVPEQIERMFIGSCEVAAYDQGFYNIGVRPFEEDLGLGGMDPFGNPLSIAKLVTMDEADVPSQELLTIHYPQFADTGAIAPIATGEQIAVMGSFKIPSLRNVAETAPYFHNGGALTLRQVIEFYNRGGDFHDYVGPDDVHQDSFMDLGIGALELTESEIDALVAFLETLTDQRVIDQTAPFDHPSLRVPNGHSNKDANGDGVLDTRFLQIPAVGRFGGPAPAAFLADE